MVHESDEMITNARTGLGIDGKFGVQKLLTVHDSGSIILFDPLSHCHEVLTEVRDGANCVFKLVRSTWFPRFTICWSL